ncbi:HD domain-containing protein [Rickettsia endosymbiont of Ceutorhynchus obstrictus]|uniref:HD domain-containing protein n=1 Tax=Rickettsia endosymbiont of Ceutorhynchus obstrictus TaxID=3066249 RepID=UPI003133052B
MEDINCWEEKFEMCGYAKRLLDKITYLNKLVRHPIDIREVKKGLYYARKYHGTQMRQSGDPYYSHPVEVAYMVAEYTAHEAPKLFIPTMLNAALLHDTIEDTPLTEDDIAKIFDKDIAKHVEGLTRIKPYGKINSEKLVNLLIAEKNIDALFIKLFDRIHNMQTISAKSPEKAMKIIKETTLIFITLSAYLGNLKLEKELYNLCLQAAITFKIFPLVNDLDIALLGHSVPLFSPVSQNNKDLKYNL